MKSAIEALLTGQLSIPDVVGQLLVVSFHCVKIRYVKQQNPKDYQAIQALIPACSGLYICNIRT